MTDEDKLKKKEYLKNWYVNLSEDMKEKNRICKKQIS